MSSRGTKLLFRSLKNKFHNFLIQYPRMKKLTSFLISCPWFFYSQQPVLAIPQITATQPTILLIKPRKHSKDKSTLITGSLFIAIAPSLPKEKSFPATTTHPRKKAPAPIALNGNILSRPMHLNRASLNGETVTPTV